MSVTATRRRHRSAQTRPSYSSARRDPWRLAADQWCDDLAAAGRAEATVAGYRKHVGWLAGDHPHAGPWTLTPDQLEEWLDAQGWSDATRGRVLVSLKSFYSYGVRTGQLRRSPLSGISLPGTKQRGPRALDVPPAWREPLAGYYLELRARGAAELTVAARRDKLGHFARAHADPWTATADDRLRLALMLAMYAGLRRAEIAGLHSADLGPGTIRIRGKGGTERAVPLHPTLEAALRAELRRREQATDLATGWGSLIPPADGWLFPSRDDHRRPITARWLGKLMTQALPGGWTAHTLRHRFATQAYRAQRDLRAVQELLGHASPATTARYAAVPDGALSAAVLAVGLD